MGIGSVLAQDNCDCQVKGSITARENGLAVAGATIYLKEINKVTYTDSLGNYLLKNICPGTYTLVCRIIGYQERSVVINLTHTTEQDISLAEAHFHLQNISITAKKIEATSQAKNVLEGIDFDENKGKTLGEALKVLTGVSTLQTGNSIAKPIIHGMHSNRVLILNNGIRQEGQQWGSEHAPEIDPYTASKVTVIKGAAGVRYGADALGGVILVEPEDLPKDIPFAGEINTVGFSNGRTGAISGMLQGVVGTVDGNKNLSWRLQGTLKRGGNAQSPHYYLDNTGVGEQNFSATLAYHKIRWGTELYFSQFNTKLGILKDSHIGSTTDLEIAINRGEPLSKTDFTYRIDRPYQDIGHSLLKFRTYYRPTNGGQFTWTFAWQYNNRSEYDLHRPRNRSIEDSLASLTKPQLQFKLYTVTSELIWEHQPLFKKVTGQIGWSSTVQSNDTRYSRFIPDFNALTSGVFVIERLIKPHWEWEGGLRYDYRFNRVFLTNEPNQDFHFHNFSGTLGSIWKTTEHLTLRANVGSAWRAPGINELFSDGVHHGSASFEVGDRNLKSEGAINVSLTGNYERKRFSAEISLYQNFVNNFIFLAPSGQLALTIRGAFPEFRYTQVNARFRGIDASATWQFAKNLAWTSKYSFLSAINTSTNEYLIWMPPNRLDNSLKINVGHWKKIEKISVSVSNQYVARQWRVPSDLQITDDETVRFRLYGGDFAPPPPAYSLWGLGAGFTLPNQALDFGVSVTNVFNAVYRDYLNRFRYYTSDVGRNVSLRMKCRF